MKTPYVCRNEKTLGTTTCHPEDGESSARRRTPDEGSMYCACATAKRKQMQRPFSRHESTASCLQALPRIATSRVIAVEAHARTASPEIPPSAARTPRHIRRSEEHTSELQSQSNLVCRLLLEK